MLFPKFVFYFFKSIGLATISLSFQSTKSVNKVQHTVFKRSKFGILYNVVLIFTLICANYYITKLTLSLTSDIAAIIKFDRAIDLSRIVLTVMISIYILVFFCIQQNRLLQIANKMKTLTELSASLNNGKQNIVVAKGICSTHIILSLISFISIILCASRTVILQFIATLACDFIITSLLVQYIVSLKLLQRLLDIVNECFAHFCKESLTLAQEDVNVISNIRSNKFGQRLKLIRFLQLRELRFGLYEVAEDLDKFYSRPVFLSISYIFVSLIFFAYFITKGVMQRTESLISQRFFFISVTLLRFVIPMIGLSGSVSNVIVESKRTGKVVSKWLGNMQNEEIAMKLNQFLNHLLHQNFEFTASGLFSLDSSLLMSIAGSITTYMMILLQFQGQGSKSTV